MMPVNRSKESKSKSMRTRGHTLLLKMRSKETSLTNSLLLMRFKTSSISLKIKWERFAPKSFQAAAKDLFQMNSLKGSPSMISSSTRLFLRRRISQRIWLFSRLSWKLSVKKFKWHKKIWAENYCKELSLSLKERNLTKCMILEEWLSASVSSFTSKLMRVTTALNPQGS
jgi:hypothetical protein